jgi:hypothetical protein
MGLRYAIAIHIIGIRMSEKTLPYARNTMVIGIPVGSSVKPPNSGISVRNGMGRISRAKIIAANIARIAILLESVLSFILSEVSYPYLIP